MLSRDAIIFSLSHFIFKISKRVVKVYFVAWLKICKRKIEINQWLQSARISPRRIWRRKERYSRHAKGRNPRAVNKVIKFARSNCAIKRGNRANSHLCNELKCVRGLIEFSLRRQRATLSKRPCRAEAMNYIFEPICMSDF
jgi:hypothetical protein